MFVLSAEDKIKKATIKMMRHPETAGYSGIMMLGKSEVTEDPKFPTACTNGKDRLFNRKFIDNLTVEETAGLVMHENFHIMLMHLSRHKDLWQEDAQLANAAADYVVNSLIMELEDKTLCHLPKGGHYDAKFRGWSVREVYDFLKTGKEKDQPQPKPGGRDAPQRGDKNTRINGRNYPLDTLDEHQPSGGGGEEQTPEQREAEAAAEQALQKQVTEALHQGGLLAGRMGSKMNRAVTEVLEPEIDWREVLREFVTVSSRGKDEATWRRFNVRRMADDYYLPSVENETIGEIAIAIDTSGSIGSRELAEFAGYLAVLCEQVNPDTVRILWWDTEVHGEQTFSGSYDNIAHMLKPQGGGGTHAGCVSQYLVNKKIKPDCVVMFTDGYCEGNIAWEVKSPTLWLVTQNRHFTPPAGTTMVKMD